MMSGSEKEDEEMFMNPNKIEEIQKQKEQVAKDKRERLLNSQINVQKSKKMFDAGERTIHQDLPPAKDRIEEYSRKSFGQLFTKFEDRPFSGKASSVGLAEITTQA